MRGNRMKRLAVLLVCAVLTVELPVMPEAATNENKLEEIKGNESTEAVSPEEASAETEISEESAIEQETKSGQNEETSEEAVRNSTTESGEGEETSAETIRNPTTESGESEETSEEAVRNPTAESSEGEESSEEAVGNPTIESGETEGTYTETTEEQTAEREEVLTENVTQQDTDLPLKDKDISDKSDNASGNEGIQYILGREMTPEEIDAQKAMEPDYLPELELVELPAETVENANISSRRKVRAALPAQYDTRENSSFPAVRNQNPWGACWTFAFLGLMEYSLVQQELAQAESVNLSEHHLAYFTYHTGNDALDNANDDTIESTPQDYYLQSGGNDYRAALRLMNWQGAAQENEYPYPDDKNLPDGISRDLAQDCSVCLKNCSFYPANANDAETRPTVKSLIMENGCISWSYYSDSKYLNYSTAAYFNNERTGTNHAIIVVGWDDDYAKENFNSDRMPENNGAWIVRNSWGEKWGKEGYFYISYEDVSLGSGNAVCVAQAELSGKYDNNYFHSNSLGMKQYGKYKKVAQIYQTKSPEAVKEELAAVSFMTGSAGIRYEIQVYKNPQLVKGVVEDPESGTAMLKETVTGTIPYAGVYTAELPNPIEFDADDYMAIVISFPEDAAFMYCDSDYTASASSVGSCTAKNTVEAGESLYMLSSTWQDMSKSGRSLRINALTVDVNTTVTIPTLSIIETHEAAGFVDTPYALLRWSKCSNAQGYEVYRSLDGENYDKIVSVGADIRQYRDSLPAREETDCFYQVKVLYGGSAEGEASTTEESNIVNWHFSGEIEGVELYITYNGKTAKFSWNAVDGADWYELQQREEESGAFETIQTFQGAEQTSYIEDVTDTALGIYQYRIRACKDTEDKTVYSQWSDADLAKDLVVESSGYQTATLAWLPISGADEYKVRILVGSTWHIYSIKNSEENEVTSYTFEFEKTTYQVETGEPYQYRVMAYQANEAIYTSSTITHCLPPDTLNVCLDTESAGGITLKWSGGSGASGVAIYRSENAQEEGELVGTADIAAGSYTDSAPLALKTAYFYYFVPFVENSAGDKIYGAATDVVKAFQPPARPQPVSVEEQDGAILVQWPAVAGAEGFLVEKSINSDTYVQAADIAAADAMITIDKTQDSESENNNTCRYVDKDVQRCNQYQYRITAYYDDDSGDAVKSDMSKVSTIRLLPEPIAIESVQEIDAGKEEMRIAISIPQVENAQYYQLYRSETGEDGSYEQIAKLTDSGVYTDFHAVFGTQYFYKVLVTINAFTSALEDTQAVKIVTKPKTPEPITILSAAEAEDAQQGTKVVLTIPWVENAQYYLLYRSEAGESEGYQQIAKIAEVEGTDTITYIDSDVEPDTEYFYKALVCINGVTSVLEETTTVKIVTKGKETETETTNPEGPNPDESDPETPDPDESNPDNSDSDDSDNDNSNPDDTKPEKPIIPESISILSVKEIHAGQQGAQITITIPMVEKVQYYLVYRSEDGESGAYMQIARIAGVDNAALEGSYHVDSILYTDSDIQPDTEYFYKVLVMVNGETSILEQTKAAGIITKPILQSFALWLPDSDMRQGSSQELVFSVIPSHYPYAPEELIWSAQDKDGTELLVNDVEGKTVVVGTDGKEILSITDGIIYAAGISVVQTVHLFATLDSGTAEAIVFIYQNEGFQVTSVENQRYTGSAITPQIQVYDQGRLLTRGEDYNVSYANNKNVNNASAGSKAPSVIVTGKGNYTGKEVVTFSILPVDISNSGTNLDKNANGTIIADNMVCAYRKNKTQKPVPIVLWNGVRLKKGKDFTVEYPDTGIGAYREVGEYTMRINGINNFTGTRELALVITNEGLISKTTVSKIKAQSYTGGEIKPLLTVKSGKHVLVENQDYTVTYENNVEIGTATAIITGTGVIGNSSAANNTSYYGVKRVTFQITGTNINKAVVTGLDKSVVYTGMPIKQENCVLTIKTPHGFEVLTEGRDYLAIQNSVNAGTGYITFQGINAYTGTLKKSFRITPYDLGADAAQQLEFSMETHIPYAKGGSKPDVQIVFGKAPLQNNPNNQKGQQNELQSSAGVLLQIGIDYKLSYQNHTTISQTKTPTVIITGKGNFKGKKTLEFTIIKQELDRLSIVASDKVYTGKPGAYKTKLSVVDFDGKTLKAGKDYLSKVTYTYAQPVTLSDGTMRKDGEIVDDRDIVPIGTILNATVMGINYYQGSLTGQFRIAEFDISKAKVTITPQTYTGTEIEPAVEDITVAYKGRVLEYGTEYVIERCSDNIKKGKGTMQIKGIGDYGGRKNAKFTIRSKKVLLLFTP